MGYKPQMVTCDEMPAPDPIAIRTKMLVAVLIQVLNLVLAVVLGFTPLVPILAGASMGIGLKSLEQGLRKPKDNSVGLAEFEGKKIKNMVQPSMYECAIYDTRLFEDKLKAEGIISIDDMEVCDNVRCPMCKDVRNAQNNNGQTALINKHNEARAKHDAEARKAKMQTGRKCRLCEDTRGTLYRQTDGSWMHTECENLANGCEALRADDAYTYVKEFKVLRPVNVPRNAIPVVQRPYYKHGGLITEIIWKWMENGQRKALRMAYDEQAWAAVVTVDSPKCRDEAAHQLNGMCGCWDYDEYEVRDGNGDVLKRFTYEVEKASRLPAPIIAREYSSDHGSRIIDTVRTDEQIMAYWRSKANGNVHTGKNGKRYNPGYM